MKRATVFALIAVAFAAALAMTCALEGCKLDPAKMPPCTGRESYPDPCAAAHRDASIDAR